MKFAEHLQAHLTPEWRTQYIKYDDLKDFLYKCANEMPQETDEEIRQAFFMSKDEEFYNTCHDELSKINDFFEEKVAESKRRLKDLEQELSEYKQFKQQLATHKLVADGVDAVLPGTMIRRYRNMKKQQGRIRKLKEIKLAFQEFYLNLILLQNYQTLNFTGFRKILKKHDKIFGLSSGYQWRVRNVESARFNVSKDVMEFIDRVEQVYIGDLERGDRHTAMKRLRVPPLTEREKPGTTFLVGFLFGIFSMQSLSVTIAIAYLGHGIEPWQPGLRLFRAAFLVPLFICLLGVNTYGWRAAGVNHVLIFEIDPRHHLNHMEILKAGGVLAVAWCAALQLFVFSGWLAGLPPYAAPLLSWAFMPVYLLNPLPVCQHKSRRWLCRILLRILVAPFRPVAFSDFWLADQLNSMSVFFIDLAYGVCYYASGAVYWGAGAAVSSSAGAGIAAAAIGNATVRVMLTADPCSGLAYGLAPLFGCLPAWFRFAQCLRRYWDMPERHAFPHLVNAGKYSMTFFVTAGAVAHQATGNWIALTVHICLFLLAAAYGYSWDILMDWGLLYRPKEGQLLREDLVYNRTWVYYAAMIENLLLRLSGLAAIAVAPYMTEGGHQVLLSCLAVLEVVRRFVWNYFRLENEHLNNCGQFRAVRDINIKPVNVPRDTDVGFNGSNCGGGGGGGPEGGGADGGGDGGDRVSESGSAAGGASPIAPKRYAPYLYRASVKRREQQQQEQQLFRSIRSIRSSSGGGGGSSRWRATGEDLEAILPQQQPQQQQQQQQSNTSPSRFGNLSMADAFLIADRDEFNI